MSDCSPPSPDKYINTWTKAERKEREKEGSPTTVQGYLLKTLFLHSGQNTKCSDKPAILYRFVHGTVHLLYCINTHTLITVLPYTFIFFNYWVNPTWWRINPQCTVQYYLFLSVFVYDSSVLLTVPPPPPAKIYTEAVLGRGKEEEKFTTKSVHHLVNCFEVHHCTPYISRHYCIALPYNSIHSWGIVHSTHITCSLFTPLAAALSHSTV